MGVHVARRELRGRRWLPPLGIAGLVLLFTMDRAFKFQAVLSQPEGATQRRTGFVHEAVASDYDDLDGCKAYLCGPPLMLQAVQKMLDELGVPEEQWVYLHGCADAHDHWYISDRHNFYTSPAMRVFSAKTRAATC